MSTPGGTGHATLRIDILTLFPGMFAGPFAESIVARARVLGAVEIGVVNLRDFTTDRHRTADDTPFGGGPGMVMKAEPIFAAVEALRTPSTRTILLSPRGRVFNQSVAVELSGRSHLVLICGHYEGVDERVRSQLVDDEISIGDYVLTGGELPAMVVVDAISRLLPGVLGARASLDEESHSGGLLEYPHYTRPAEFRGWRVPDVLLSGNHAAVARWRRLQALLITRARRPDLLTPEHRAELDSADQQTKERAEQFGGQGEPPLSTE